MLCRLFQRWVLVLLAYAASEAASISPVSAVQAKETVLAAKQARNPIPMSNPIQASEFSGPSGPQYHVTRWTAENGLPQSSIKALAQTRDGYLWIGTLKGLVRFDGVRPLIFDQSNTPEVKHDSINDLAEDQKEDGLWIGTGGELLYYREHRFQRFGAQHGIPGAAGVLCAAKDGGVWFSPRDGQVALARAGKVQVWNIGLRPPTNYVYQIAEESPSGLLLLVYDTMYRFDFNAGLLTPFAAPSPPARSGLFFREDDGSFWLCREDGLWRGKEGSWTRATTADARWPWQIHRTKDGQLWVVDSNGLAHHSLRRLMDGRLVPPGIPEISPDLNVTHFIEDREGNIWIGTSKGLFRLEPKRVQVYSSREGLRNDEVLAVAAGSDGTIWLGTGQGVSRVCNGQTFDVAPPSDWPELWLVPPDKISALLVDSRNQLWLQPNSAEILGFTSNRWTEWYGPPQVKEIGPVQFLFEDHECRIWLGCRRGALPMEGVFRVEDRGWTAFTPAKGPTRLEDTVPLEASYPTTFTVTNGLSNGDVRVIYQDRRGDIWFGTFGGGLNRLHDGKFTAYQTTRGEYNNRAWWIHEDADGVFWVGSEDGLNRFVPPGVAADPARRERLSPEAESRKRKSEDRSDQSLLTSAATREDSERFFTFTKEQHGLLENVVNNIQEDDFGYLWLSGLRGIYRVSRQQLNDVAAGIRTEVECLALGEADGMLNSECNGGDNQPAGCKDRDGRIWFPTVQGVVVIDPKEVQRAEVPPLVVIEQVKANDEVVFGDGVGADVRRLTSKIRNPKSEIRTDQRLLTSSPTDASYQLPPGGARVLEIRYTANSLVAPEKLRFKYRLKGYDQDWRSVGDQRVAFYTNLRPRQYQFELRACNHHGVWCDQPARFAFTVARHFYETWMFYGACAIGLIGLAVGTQAFRLRVQRRILRLDHQRSLELERMRIARDLHDDLGASLTGIALQLEAARSGGKAEGAELGALANEARALTHDLRELAWTTNPRCDNSGSLAAFVGEFAERFCRAAGVACRLDLPGQDLNLVVPARVRHDLLMVVKESLANVSKHAQAKSVSVGLALTNGHARLTIGDDGKGFHAARGFAGSGLRNIRERVEQAGGFLELDSRPGSGTTITVTLALEQTTDRRR